MGYCLQTIGGFNAINNSVLKKNIERLSLDVEAKSNSTKWEKLQVNALQYLSVDNADAAIRQWEEILVEFPSDVLSLQLAGLTCLISGRLGSHKLSLHRRVR